MNSLLMVKPSEIHHFPVVNVGRFGLPVDRQRELDLIPRLAKGWNLSVGSCCMGCAFEGLDLSKDTPIRGVDPATITAKAAVTQREERYLELVASNEAGARVYKELYQKGGKWIVPKYWGWTANRRTRVYPEAIALGLQDGMTLGDFDIPLQVMPFVDWETTLSDINSENNEKGREGYSASGKLLIARTLFLKGHTGSVLGRHLGLDTTAKRGTMQKIESIVAFDARFDTLNFIDRLILLQPVDGEGKRIKKYSPTGYIPYGGVSWKALKTLSGERIEQGPRKNEWFLEFDHDKLAGIVATPEEAENLYLKPLVEGGNDTYVLTAGYVIAKRKLWATQAHIKASVDGVLLALLQGDTEFFDALTQANQKAKAKK